MRRLFNKDFFKFSFGFVAMVLFGLMGILLTGFFDASQNPAETTPVEVIENVLNS